MIINVKNLGVLKQAEFELGELTLIYGRNNTWSEQWRKGDERPSKSIHYLFA